MPVSAEQWRAATGSLNASRGFRPRPSIKPPSLCDLPSPPPSSWKGYIAAFIMLCVPLLYKVYVVGVTVIVYLCSGRTPHGVTNGPYPTGVGLSADVSNICLNHYGGMFLFLLNVVLYVTVATAVLLAHCRRRDKCQWKLTQQLHHLDLFWLSSGPECEVTFDPTTRSIYATLEMKSEGTDLHCECCTSNPVKRKKNQVNGTSFMGVVSFIPQLSTLVVAMLLLLAGDVERNPGPVTGLNIRTLTNELHSVRSDWHELGIQLQIDMSQLRVIEEQYPRIDRRLSEVLIFWLDGNTAAPVCWESITEALKRIDKRRLAEQLHSKYCLLKEDVTTPDLEAATRKRPRPSKEPVSSENEPRGQRSSLDGAQGGTSGDEQLGTCSTATKKIRYSFPYLDVSGLSDDEFQARQMQLCKDFDNMTGKFQTLVDTIATSITERKIEISKVLRCISELSKTLEPVYTDLHQRRSKLRHRIPELIKATSIDEVMIIVSEYSSFFNYHLIAQIIKSVGTKEDKAKLAEYETEFQKYAQRTVFACPPEIGMTSSKDRLSFVVKVHHEGFEDCTVSHLRRFINKINEILELPIGMLLLESVVPGCLELTLQVPLVVHQTIFPLSTLQEEALAALGVTKISAGDYQYPSCRDEGDSDHKPDERPDDGPSDSGFDTLSTVLSELSELKQDMIDRDATNPYEVDVEYKTVRQSNEKPSSKKNESQSMTPLHVAAYFGRLDHVKVLVETNKFSPLQRYRDGSTALHYASEGQRLNVLKYFVEEQNCNPTTTGQFDETPLHVAARCGHLDIVTYLVSEQGVDPMCKEGDCFGTPLHAACIGGNIEVVRFLVNEFNKYLDIKEIVSDKTKEGATCLHLAALNGHLEIVKHFISDMNTNPNIPGPNGLTPLHAAAQGGHVEVMRYFMECAKCNPMSLNDNKFTPLHSAAGKGQLEAVKFLTQIKHCDPMCRDKFDRTPLHAAAMCGHLNVVKFYIENLNCDPNIPNANKGLTPLHVAAQEGHVDIMKYLIECAKCNPMSQSVTKATPLHSAAAKGQLEAVNFLIQIKHCDPMCRNINGGTPLHAAASHGHLNVVKFFIETLNCDPNIPNVNVPRPTPLHAAAQGGHVEIMKYLIDCAKCNPMSLAVYKVTPLHLAAAAEKGQLEAVKYLTQTKDCDPMCRDIVGHTPLLYAAGMGHLNVVKFFIETLNCPPDVTGLLGATPMGFAAMGGHHDVVKYLQTALLVKSGINFYTKYTHVITYH